MKKKEMRLQFENPDLKSKLEDLAKQLDVSLNHLVNMICAAEFSEQDKKVFELFKGISSLKEVELN